VTKIILGIILSTNCFAGLIDTGAWTCSVESSAGTVTDSGFSSCSVGPISGGGISQVNSDLRLGAGGNIVSGNLSATEYANGELATSLYYFATTQGGNTSTLTTQTAGPVRSGFLLYDYTLDLAPDDGVTAYAGLSIDVNSPWFSADVGGITYYASRGPTVVPVILGVPFAVSFSDAGGSDSNNEIGYDFNQAYGTFEMQFFESDGVTPVALLIDTPEPGSGALAALGMAALILLAVWRRRRLHLTL
jgi:MYXO-CTERM domain-containing protein